MVIRSIYAPFPDFQHFPVPCTNRVEYVFEYLTVPYLLLRMNSKRQQMTPAVATINFRNSLYCTGSFSSSSSVDAALSVYKGSPRHSFQHQTPTSSITLLAVPFSSFHSLDCSIQKGYLYKYNLKHKSL